MIHISQPKIVECSDSSFRLEALVTTEGVAKNVWFEVDRAYGDYLVDDRSDSFVIAYINYAMIFGYDIESEAPVSEELFYQLTQYYIPGLSNSDKRFKHIRLLSRVTDKKLKSAEAVGTGMSAGIDSLSTVYLHSMDNCPEGLRITHLTYFNVGAAVAANTYRYGFDQIVEFKDRDIVERTAEINRALHHRAMLFAETNGYSLVRIDTNLVEVQPIRYNHVLTQRNCAAVLAIQKLFKVYYFASSHVLEKFSIRANSDPTRYDIFSLDMFSTISTRFYSSGTSYSRVQKTKMVANFEPSYSSLHVCWLGHVNCGWCKKCIRTLVTLDLLGELERYSTVFNLHQYRENRERLMAKMLGYSWADEYFGEIRALFRITPRNWSWLKLAWFFPLYFAISLVAKSGIPKLLPENVNRFISQKLNRVSG